MTMQPDIDIRSKRIWRSAEIPLLRNERNYFMPKNEGPHDGACVTDVKLLCCIVELICAVVDVQAGTSNGNEDLIE